MAEATLTLTVTKARKPNRAVSYFSCSSLHRPERRLPAFALLQSNTSRKSTECSVICGILRPRGGRKLTNGEILVANDLGEPW
jgi:ABC-type antimicrobial peptide transport system ATPase subunit